MGVCHSRQSRRASSLVLLIDGDNAEAAKVGAVIEAASHYGHLRQKRLYGDFSSAAMKQWSSAQVEHAIRPMHQQAYTKGKNATDIAMVIDAMDLLRSGQYRGLIIMTSDSDFTPLVQRAREEGLAVYGFGAQKTPQAFVNACSRFEYVDSSTAGGPTGRPNLAAVSHGEGLGIECAAAVHAQHSPSRKQGLKRNSVGNNPAACGPARVHPIDGARVIANGAMARGCAIAVPAAAPAVKTPLQPKAGIAIALPGSATADANGGSTAAKAKRNAVADVSGDSARSAELAGCAQTCGFDADLRAALAQAICEVAGDEKWASICKLGVKYSGILEPLKAKYPAAASSGKLKGQLQRLGFAVQASPTGEWLVKK